MATEGEEEKLPLTNTITSNINNGTNDIGVESTFIKDPKVESGKKFVDIFGKILPSLYSIAAVGILGIWITGFVALSLRDIMISTILGTSFAASLLGAWAVYKYGVIQDQINRLKEQNAKYEYEIDRLSATRERLEKEVHEIQATVQDLEHDAHELDKETTEFQGLIEELAQIAGDNEDIAKLLDNTNRIFNDMRNVVLENEKAHLLSMYYECAFRDADNRMDENEYNRFLGRLSVDQREKFHKLGSFDELSGDDDFIDLDEFQGILKHILSEVDDLLRKEFKKSTKKSSK